MSSEKQPQIKTRLHARNKNRERYDLGALITAVPELKNHLAQNKFGEESVDFSSSQAVKLLNRALLKHYYGIAHWEFPDENLSPPIPGRADYLHYMADLLVESNFGIHIPGDKITCLDIGVGASCIYPIIGVAEYNWNFIGSDINPKSIESAQHIVNSNPSLASKIECRLQKNETDMFQGIVDPAESIDLTICNPPFHASMESAQKGTQRKIKNLSGKKVSSPPLNFAGISKELIYDGGEKTFIHRMIKESKRFATNCHWFSTLVSKQSNLKGIHGLLKEAKAQKVKTISMGTGNKSSRIVAWTFLSRAEQRAWRETKWKALS